MNTILNKISPITLAVMLAGFGCVSSANAQNNDNFPTPAMHTGDCKDMIWNTELVSKYPRIAPGCRDVVIVDGEKWARFEASFVSNNSDGSFTSEFMDTRNRSLGNITLLPRPDQRATVNGKKVRFTELRRNQKLNYYIPEGAADFALEPGVPSAEYVSIVRYDEEPEVEVERSVPRDNRMAMVDPAPVRNRSRLPDTAGPLPLLGLGGLLSLLGGAGLSLRRRFGGR